MEEAKCEAIQSIEGRTIVYAAMGEIKLILIFAFVAAKKPKVYSSEQKSSENSH